MRNWLLLILGVISSYSVYALPMNNFFDDHERGWHWFEKDSARTNEPETKEKVSPINDMQKIRIAGKKLLDQAVLSPTRENVLKYIAFQRLMERQSTAFANSWEWVLRHHPELDNSLQVPSSDLARGIYWDETRAHEDAAINTLAKHSGLFFFYKSTCPYCARFAPILKSFLSQYGLSVVAITTDGIPLPDFPDSKIDSGQSTLFHVTAEPALFIVTPKLHRVEPVSFGLVSEEILRKRILTIATELAEEQQAHA